MRITDLFNKKQLRAEIADTPFSLERGLMFRRSLDDDSGMLFKFNSSKKLSFWGCNTYIPLDIAFITDEGVITKISHISPLSMEPVKSEKDCTMALEANYGYFNKNRIREGDKISIGWTDGKLASIEFEEV